MSRSARRGTLAAAVVAFVVPFAIFFPSLGGDLVYDDYWLIVVDDFLHERGHFWDILTLRILTMDVVDWYRPLSLLSLMADAWIWGREAFGYHLMNVLLHAVNTALVFFVVVNITRRTSDGSDARRTVAGTWMALALALCFGLHPLTTETVCVASFREDLLVALFVLSSLLVTDAALDKTHRAWTLTVVGLLQLLAVTSKESGIALAPAVVVYWLTFCPRESRAFAFRAAAVCGAIIVAFLVARFSLGPSTSQIYKKPLPLSPSLSGWFRLQPRIWTYQLQSALDIRQLSIWYPVEIIRESSGPLALLVSGGAALVGLLTAWKLPFSRVGLVIIAAAMLPVANLVPLYVPIADRFLYLPLAGAALAVGGAPLSFAVKASAARRLWLVTAGACLLLPFLATATVHRQQVFSTSVKLWEDAQRKFPRSVHVTRLMALAYLLAGDYENAERIFEVLVKRQPFMWDHAGLAIASYERGDRVRAEAHLAEAVKIDPTLRSIDTLPSGSILRILGAERVARMLDEFKLR